EGIGTGRGRGGVGWTRVVKFPAVFDQLPPDVTMYEVGPRDGLQNESRMVPTADKVQLIDALSATGLRAIEITSFVNPKWIPQLADGAEVSRRIARKPGLIYSALVPNRQGLDAAIASGMKEVAVFMSASETHNKKNVNKSIADTLRAFAEVVPPALAAGLRVRAYLSTAFGCPYEGDVDPEAVVRWTRELRDLGCYQISISDTIGVANPAQVEDVLERCLAVLPIEAAAVHFHDTQGTALANCLVAIAKGVTTVDASVGGLGGCPYAPGASGNLATEDLVAMLHAMGVDTGIDLDRLVDCSRMAAAFVGHELPSKYFKAHLGKQARVRRAAERATQKEGQG
ncbi:MAG TPA: hydroxymethylglutaryl-CoA lyase, partial [Kofleriaceae bacterium]|nr:hydroxymethylglutaryl-CoA lyase [Kofleriaceae bacterium]